MARHRRHDDDDDERFEDDWDKSDKHQRKRLRLTAYFPYIVLTLLLLGIVTALVCVIFKPFSESILDTRLRDDNSFADRATAFKILEFMENNRMSEAITLAESLAGRLPNLERDIAHQITNNPRDFRLRLEKYICGWILVSYSAATQSTLAKRAGFPSVETPDTVVHFLCDYADYRARNFAPPSREIDEDILCRIFLQAVDQKFKRAK